MAHWKKAVEIVPDHAEALYNLSLSLAKTAPNQAHRYRESFVALQKKRQLTDRAQTLGNFALASAAARDWVQAVAQLQEALEVCGDCTARPNLHKNLGLIYCRSGDLKSGKNQLRIASQYRPTDADIQRALKMIESLQQ